MTKQNCHQSKSTTGLDRIKNVLIQRRTYLSEFDLFLDDLSGRCGAASAVHEPASVSNQDHIRLLHGVGQAAGQRVAHLVPQESPVGVDLKRGGMDFMRMLDRKLIQ